LQQTIASFTSSISWTRLLNAMLKPMTELQSRGSQTAICEKNGALLISQSLSVCDD
jgi:hypothetical protein